MASNSLDALRILAGSGMSTNANNPGGLVMGRANQDQRLSEMKRNLSMGLASGASPFDVQDLEASMADDPDFGDAAQAQVAGVNALNSKMSAYGRPDVTAMRQHDEKAKLQLAGEPARVAGQANVEAAKVAAGSKANLLNEMLGMGAGGKVSISGVGSVGPDPSALQSQKDQAADNRIGLANGAGALRDRLKALETGKAHAQQPGGIMGFFGGNKAADDAEIASLQHQLIEGGQGSPAPRAGQAEVATAQNAPAAPAGWRYVPKPGGGWTAVRQ